MIDNPLTPEKQAVIDAMSQLELCRSWRFHPIGNPFWQGEAGQYATDRLWKHFGGFTPEISKALGWDAGPI